MPEMLLEEGYVINLADLFHQIDICHFCHDCCVHVMPMSSTYVLLRVLPSFQRCNPCIFVMCVVTRTSLRREVPEIADFRDLVIFAKSGIF